MKSLDKIQEKVDKLVQIKILKNRKVHAIPCNTYLGQTIEEAKAIYQKDHKIKPDDKIIMLEYV